jgi:hypothetical protein
VKKPSAQLIQIKDRLIMVEGWLLEKLYPVKHTRPHPNDLPSTPKNIAKQLATIQKLLKNYLDLKKGIGPSYKIVRIPTKMKKLKR